MFVRFFRLLGLRTGDQIMDFVMLGAVVLPLMFLIGDQPDAAALAVLLALPAIMLAGAWTRSLDTIRKAEEQARERFRRRLGGRDD